MLSLERIAGSTAPGSSPALRALAAAQLIADEIGYERKDIDDRLYASSAGDLLAIIRALDKKLDRPLPDIQELKEPALNRS